MNEINKLTNLNYELYNYTSQFISNNFRPIDNYYDVIYNTKERELIIESNNYFMELESKWPSVIEETTINDYDTESDSDTDSSSEDEYYNDNIEYYY